MEGKEHEAARAEKLSDESAARAIVKRIVMRGRTAVLVLSGGHDLSKAIKPTGWGYIQVTPRGYPD